MTTIYKAVKSLFMKKIYVLLALMFSINIAASALSTLGVPAGSNFPATICVPAANQIVYQFEIDQTGVSANLDSFRFSTAGSTYAAGDVVNYKLWYNTTNNFGTAVNIASLGSAGPGAFKFPSGTTALSASLLAGASTYYWITVSFSGTGSGNTLTVLPLASTNISVSAGGASGFTTIGGTQTLNTAPAAITSVSSTYFVCTGSSITLSDAVGGGSWTSGSPSVATVSGGIVSAAGSTGTATISYTIGSCTATAIVTVGTAPPAIAPYTPISVCVDSIVTVTDAVPGGSWSTSSTGVGVSSISPGVGAVSGLTVGTANITYTLAPGCSTITTVTVNPLPNAIVGPTSVCAYGENPVTLTDATTGGTWSSGPVVTIGTGSTCIVYGVAPGSTGIFVTYTLPTGCAAAFPMTVNPWPLSITGRDTLCASSLDTLSDPSGGGTWSSSNPLVATIGATTGYIIGTGTGVSVMTYTNITSGCYNTQPIYVYPFGPIIDSPSICVSVPFTLGDTTSGGIWSISNTSIASIGATSGIITGIAGGLDTVTYTIASHHCMTTDTIRVYPLPGPITGPSAVCAGSNIALADSVAGGTWTSSNTGVSIIGSTTGIDSGVAAGTVTITFTAPVSGCNATKLITVNPLPAAITGTNNVCVGSTVTLSDITTPGSWTASNGKATISSSGVVTGVSAGIDTIYYTVAGTGCNVSYVVTVNPLPVAVSGTLVVCNLYSTSLSDASTGGTWSSVAPLIATVGSASGVVTGVAPGIDSVYYTLPTGCTIGVQVTVNALPAPISGTLVVCSGYTTTLSDGSSLGTWSSANTSIATITSGGVVTGVAGGTDTISYTFTATGCPAVAVVTVNATPPAITAASFNVCYGATISLSDATSGGTWSSANTSVATVDGSGNVTGISATLAITTITYTIPTTGCYVVHSVTVNPLPQPITGTFGICAGSTSDLSDITPGGSWSSSNIPVATVGGLTGIVSGISSGNAVITYTSASGCIQVAPITVNPIPGVITGTMELCQYLTTTLSDTSVGGTWVSTNTSKATVDPSTGIVTAVDSYLVTIEYMYAATGCYSSAVLTINPGPLPITGPSSICIGVPTTFTDATTGGTWISGAPGFLTLTTSGDTAIITGTAATGLALIGYQTAYGCVLTTDITINSNPSAIYGPSSAVCVGQQLYLNDSSLSGGTPGVWTVANATATVGSGTGIVSGVTPGLDTVAYTFSGTGCSTSYPITVNPLSPIMGNPVVCVGGATTLSDTTTGGGSWVSSDGTIATVSSTGVVTGVSSGLATILFVVTGTGCQTSVVVTVNPVPSAIGGGNNVCVGSTLSLTDVDGPLTWSSSLPGTATVDATAGVVTGVSVGTATITASFSTGCYTTELLTVNPVAPVVGPTEICIGVPVVYTDSLPGGTWSVGTSTIATINSTTGAATGSASGTVFISYTIASTGCVATLPVTITPIDSILPAFPQVCVGGTTTLTDATTGGTWSSGNNSIATISSTGIVTGVSSGTVTISYQLVSGCIAITALQVNPVTPIFGNDTICQYLTTSLHDTTLGGIWSIGDTSIGTISTTGVVTGKTLGITTVYYVLGTGCTASTTVDVIGISPITSSILSHQVCPGQSLILRDTAGGGAGTWSSTTGAVATVTPIGSGLGQVVGVNPGVVNITYTAGCIAIYPVTVNPNPSPIMGVDSLCAWGGSLTVMDTTAGGIWSASLVTVASIGTGTGLVTGAGAGTGTVTWTLPTGCYVTKTVTVNPLPNPIVATPSNIICMGSTTSLTDGTPGGNWINGNAAIASLTTGGSVAGLAPGVVVDTYKLSTGCYDTIAITVQPNYPINGVAALCVGDVDTFTDSLTGGTWSVIPTTIANVIYSSGGTAAIHGVAAGLATVQYTITATGCTSTKLITVNPVPMAISGPTSVCVLDSILLTDPSIGGVWGTSDSTKAIAMADGEVYGEGGTGAGSVYIYYTYPATGCRAIDTITVNPSGPIIAPLDSNICLGVATTLIDTAAGGTWTLSNNTIATIIPLTGTTALITGTLVDTTTFETVTYTIGSCVATLNLHIYPQPAAILGNPAVCVGLTDTMVDTVAGGHWSVTNSTGIISGAGVFKGLAAGVDTVLYTMPSGCFVWYVVTINPNPVAISGPSNICGTDSVTYHDITPFGYWSITDSVIANMNGVGQFKAYPSTGAIDTIIYTISATGCRAIKVVTINPLENIIGPSHICQDVPTPFFDSIATGVWSSSSTSVITISATTGVAMGLAIGSAIISYVIPSTGCTAYESVTVNPSPAPIIGPSFVCIGQSVTMTDAVSGGTWTSHYPGIARIDSNTGVVTGISTGTVIITYSFGTGCYVVTSIIVDPLSPIVGPNEVCYGSTIALTDSTPGGYWTSGNIATATVALTSEYPLYTGTVTGTAAAGGTVLISYTDGGCTATHLVTVNPRPSHILGANHVCLYDTTMLSDADPDGVWSSYPAGYVTIETSGMTIGDIVGTVNVYYTDIITGCDTSMLFTVNPIPDSIVGLFDLCIGQTTVISDGVPGGTWFINPSSIASVTAIGTTTADLKGLSAGTATVSYILPAGCYRSHLVEVNPDVNPSITVTSSLGATICAGQVPVFTITDTHSGWAPIIYWYVNGVLKDSNVTTFTYAPVNNGDIVKVTLESNASCLLTNTAIDSVIMHVNPNIPVNLSITESATTVCQGSNVTYTAVTTTGGTTPIFDWYVNNLFVGTGTTYTYAPGIGDFVYCDMISSLTCATPDTAVSTDTLRTHVIPSLIDSIRIFATDTVVNYYHSVTFTSESTNYGWAPQFQWYVNGIAVPGATNSTFTINNPSNVDTVYCQMWSSNPCTTLTPTSSNIIHIHIGNVEAPYVANGFNDVALIPNPNRGTFRLKGSLNTVASGEVVVEITDVVGKVVYKGTAQAMSGKLDKEIVLDDAIPNGVYNIRLTSDGESDVRHFVLDK